MYIQWKGLGAVQYTMWHLSDRSYIVYCTAPNPFHWMYNLMTVCERPKHVVVSCYHDFKCLLYNFVMWIWDRSSTRITENFIIRYEYIRSYRLSLCWSNITPLRHRGLGTTQEVSSQLHAPAILPPAKQFPVPTGQPNPIWLLRSTETPLATAGSQTTIHVRQACYHRNFELLTRHELTG